MVLAAAGVFVRDVIVAPEPPRATGAAPASPDEIARRIAAAVGRPTLPTTAPAVPSPGRIDFAVFRLPPTPPAVPVAGWIEFAALQLPTAPPTVVPPGRIEFGRLDLPTAPPAVFLAPQPGPAPGDIVMTALAYPPHLPRVDPLPSSPPAFATAPPAGHDTAPVAHASTTQCTPEPARTTAVSAPTGADAADFGAALVAAAIEQMRDLAIYNAKYTRIAYPGGDVPAFFGVCTDVVIRAYRRLGIDLQVEVQKARVGRGDASIDHRRTETLRTFLARHGESLAVSEFAEDYLPGDIVTYYRPQNRSSTAHIAIVTDRIAPSGRPMIVHNRGFGVQLEDALFVDKITGHYRYRGPRGDPALVASKAPRAAPPNLAEATRGSGVVRGQGRAALAKASAAGALPQPR